MHCIVMKAICGLHMLNDSFYILRIDGLTALECRIFCMREGGGGGGGVADVPSPGLPAVKALGPMTSFGDW